MDKSKWAEIIEDHYCAIRDAMRKAAHEIGQDPESYRTVTLDVDGNISVYWSAGGVRSAEIRDGEAIILTEYQSTGNPDTDKFWADNYDYESELNEIKHRYQVW